MKRPHPGTTGDQLPGKTLQRKVQPSTSEASGNHTGTKICQGGLVTSQRAGWTMQILFTLCLLHGLKAWLGERKSLQLATNALKGPRLVTGEPGGAVTIQCRYAPLSIYRHQRKYWCRLNPLTWICHTIVSTNSYTHRQYHGRVALTDFRHSGLFVVRLSQLSSDDVGYYRCGVGNQNDILFFSMNLTISTGSPGTLPTAAGELLTGSCGTATPAANRGTPGTTQTAERQGTGWERAAVTPGTSKTTASAKGRPTPGTAGAGAPGTDSWVEASLWATVSIPRSPAAATGGTMPSAGVWTLGPSGLETAAAEESVDRDLDTADGDSGPQATPSQAPASGPQRPLGKGSSMKSSGGRKGGRSHLASDDTPPGMPACLSRRRTLDLEDGRISCSDTMEGEPGPNTVTPAACHSVSTCTEGS
ncbi:high affinity immunoglobulin alpha and immunoglobulin mu Fc receptor isoform X2 [Manis javanica]|uniref:high affinity immunoglobulin alpha and immunoglobulin mu Fc receptor isoform X2 n=1 Tax=Manis javanica TaxID=9974 RepID=UPI003C6D5CC2